jgi:hypothetical protein
MQVLMMSPVETLPDTCTKDKSIDVDRADRLEIVTSSIREILRLACLGLQVCRSRDFRASIAVKIPQMTYAINHQSF